VVVVHDSDFMKLAGVPLKVWDGTLEDIQAIDIGSWFSPVFHAERTPTLAAVLETVKGRAGLVIELKYYGHDVALERKVVALVEAAKMAGDVTIMSLDYEGIQKIRELRPDWRIGLLSARALGDLTALDADFLAVNMGMARPGFLRRARRAGKPVFVWTVNTPVDVSRMASLGVAGIITDEPAMARSVLEERASLNVAQRLLVHAAVLFGREPPSFGRDDSP
jgi:glycerophosphoryl diester phosphodiesterase